MHPMTQRMMPVVVMMRTPVLVTVQVRVTVAVTMHPELLLVHVCTASVCIVLSTQSG